MNIRKATLEDYETILEIYQYARGIMKKNGNPTQWGDHRPSNETLYNDIKVGQLYVLEENNDIVGAFVLIIGDDPTYHIIEGAWLNNKPYGVIHRLASNGKAKGIFQTVFDYCEGQIDNIRVDTHQDNIIMRNSLTKRGYKECGIIYVDDGTSRIAFQKEIN